MCSVCILCVLRELEYVISAFLLLLKLFISCRVRMLSQNQTKVFQSFTLPDNLICCQPFLVFASDELPGV